MVTNNKKSHRDRFIAIDANAIIHRAYHAYPATLENNYGIQVNAVFGFTSMLISVIEQFDPKYIVCAFDTPSPTFRHKMYPEYKGHRKPTDQELLDQFPLVEEVLNAFNIPIIKKEGFEADDILGDLAYKSRFGKWQPHDLDFIIVSGDRDLLQLVGENVRVCLPEGSFRNLRLYDEEETFSKLGIYPAQVVDYKSLVGDPSDNIPGVRGLGVKSVELLLGKYGTVEEIYEKLDEIKPRQSKLLSEGVSQMELSRTLATISNDTGISVSIESCVVEDFSREEVVLLFQRLQFRSLLNKIPNQRAESPKVNGQIGLFDSKAVIQSDGVVMGQNTEFEVIDIPPEGISELHRGDGSKSVSVFAVYISSSSESPDNSYDLFAPTNSGEIGTLYIFNVDNSGQPEKVFRLTPSRETIAVVMGCFMDVAARETISFWNWTQFVSDISSSGFNIDLNESHSIFDIQLAVHMIRSQTKDYKFATLCNDILGKSQIDEPAEENLQFSIPVFIELASTVKKEFESIIPGEYVSRFHEKLSEKGRGGDLLYKSLYYKYEVGLTPVLESMSCKGITLDMDKLAILDRDLKKEIDRVESEIYASVGHSFNISSPKQLGEILFNELKLPSGRGKSSKSTREEVLRKLQGLHPVIGKILEYRELSKLYGTYVLPMYQLVRSANSGHTILNPLQNLPSVKVKASRKDSVSSTIHTKYLQMGASSGRLSSKDPNMQNLPAKGGLAPRVKEMFVPRKGYKFVSMDYSQIELRVLADMSKDPSLVKDFIADKDIHSGTAARVLSKPLSKVTPRERSLGKTINFGILYGQTKYGLASMLGISMSEAELYIKEYFENYPGVDLYLKEIATFVREKGYVETGIGRRRYITGLDSSNANVQSAALREAINMPIQGTAADIIKIAMVEISRYLKKNNLEDDVSLLLQIHDELVFEIKESVVEDLSEKLVDLFKGVVRLEVPIVVHKSIGDSLAELK